MYKDHFKRVFDFISSLFILLLIGWLLALIALLLFFANKGAGVFFYQERPGKEEKLFKIIKFKTMTDEHDVEGNLLPDVERLTNIGRFLRKTSIDELPQLINVLKGDMSFVGPRPLLPDYLPWYTATEKKRHLVRPGLSGWAQVNGRNNLSWDERLALDVYYVDHLSLGMDFLIIMRTIVNVLNRKDVNVVPGLKNGRLDVLRKYGENET